jgi:hypothetical protein
MLTTTLTIITRVGEWIPDSNNTPKTQVRLYPRALPMRRRRRNLRRTVSPRLLFTQNRYSGYLVDPHRSPDDTGSPQY